MWVIMSSVEMGSSSSGSVETETMGSNIIRSSSLSIEVLEEGPTRSRHNAKGTAEAEAEDQAEGSAGSSSRAEGRDNPESDTNIAVEHKRLARKREFDPMLRPGYKWVHGEVRANYSRFRDDDSILNLLTFTKFLDGFPTDDNYPIGMSRCRGVESPNPDLVFLDKSKLLTPSFYVYDCWFRDLHVKLPFDDFIMSVLRVLNVAPNQLHPNSWAAMQVFKILCLGFGVTPTTPLFLFFYNCKPGWDAEEGYNVREGENESKARWISLSRIPRRDLLESFTSSYKHFKNGFFWIGIREGAKK
ncbi:hypothetical protein Fmac_015559 [Flemingia macrophylla]|uniref:Transposase (putative) gypsy type domain-containing protein n=1 Tax=Flemingia macrophylla TaxID=520843 RepID=A0ABD1MEX2_9FABA